MRLGTTILILLVAGWFLLPYEQGLEARCEAASLKQGKLDVGLREQVGQLGFLAALSGFRSPLAALLWIEAQTAWENTEWGKMKGLFDTVLVLQPRSLIYWDIAAWHMAWNASIAALNDKTVQSEALRQRNAAQYIEVGREILERGIRNNPNSAFLHERLATLYRDKLEDHAAAAREFAAAAALPDAMAYVRRFEAYELMKCPGREHEAYEKLVALYREGEQHRLPSLLAYIRQLEIKLDIPLEKRIE